MPEPKIAELEAEARHAAERLALYQRKVHMGKGTPQRLAELQRIAEGAAGRLRRARSGGGAA